MTTEAVQGLLILVGVVGTLVLADYLGFPGSALAIVLWVIGSKAFKELTIADRVDLSRWVCPHCDAVFRKDPVQIELAKRRRARRDPSIVIAAASRNPSCPRCAKELDGQKFLDGSYDLPMLRVRQLKKQGALP